MWIRSQDKKILININTVELLEHKLEIWGTAANSNQKLGEFKLEKQANKVMDAIHQHLEMHPNQVFQIPKDSTII